MAQGRVHVGSSGWVYRHWKGTFYPEDLPSARWLPYYAERLACVEVNNTFYKLPSKSAVEAWRDAVPDDFRFVFKAHRRITHMKRLRDAREPLDLFLDALRPIEARIGVLLFQLPPFMPFDPERLDDFLGLVPQDRPWRVAFEFRNPTWHNEQTWEILGVSGVAHAIHDFDGWTPQEVTADTVYVRFHGPESPYRGRYGIETLREWADRAQAWAQEGRDVWCFFNNDQAGYAAWNAIEMRALVEWPAPAMAISERL